MCLRNLSRKKGKCPDIEEFSDPMARGRRGSVRLVTKNAAAITDYAMSTKPFHLKHSDFRDIARTVLQNGNNLRFQAHGNSMAPFIRDGDTIHLQQSGSYALGDVVLLRNNQMLLVHRIVAITQDGVTTRGDASLYEDPGPVDTGEILGKVYRVSGGGYNYHLRPPFSRLMAMPFFATYLFRNRIIRKIGKLVSPLLG
jgi:hypothetical protein